MGPTIKVTTIETVLDLQPFVLQLPEVTTVLKKVTCLKIFTLTTIAASVWLHDCSIGAC